MNRFRAQRLCTVDPFDGGDLLLSLLCEEAMSELFLKKESSDAAYYR